ncbi:hypothetical protein MFRU_008g02100 [Monilinia fructicola]|uniref:Uncharacterized protein n=1 Tax=Monilinia fructicola TaxID=38448 RepID=A0A5M9J8U1_MONFR|nr:hypothetical protein EYC84_010710 [Monilinia fructicola]KAG4031855.1 hypothetical protein MFRU_008g02100 [Monilinia fructicola]
MGALSAVLAIPYRSIKESIERSRQNKTRNNNSNKDKRQTKSAPGSRAPSLYKIGAASFEKKGKLRRADSEGAERNSQSLGHLPLVDVPWADASGVSSGASRKGSVKADSLGKGTGKGKGKGIEEASLQKPSTRLKTTAPRDFTAATLASVPAAA